ncbi:MAG: regulatory iron-sulfur-containing complex subunit RicT [Oscillospiraceae bacterium]
MTDVMSVKFKGRGKTYFFDPNGVDAQPGQQVVVETSKGLELAECVQSAHTVTDERIIPPLRPVIRVATADDLRVAELCKAREKEAFGICEKKIAEHGLDMKLVDVECNFEGNKILFFFTSDGRVDFRELVKDLAGVFRTRIELRQIGVRDEAKMLGGLGICGRPYCCHQFLDDFEPVSTKMAKVQSLSLNPAKISGSCGRLMCCLRYEQEAYEELVKTVPKNGAFVETPCGYGCVCQVNLLRQKVKVKLDGSEDAPKSFEADEVAAVPGGRPKPGEPLPHVLELKPKAPRKEEEEDDEASFWERPPMFAEETAQPALRKSAEEGARGEEPKKSGSSRRRSRRRKPAGEKSAAPAQQQPKAEQKPGGEKPEGGEKKSGGSSRRRRGGSRQGQNAPRQGEAGKQGESRPKTQQQKPAGSKPQQPKPQNGQNGQGAQAPNGEKKKSNNRRRRGGKPKQGGAPAPVAAPKSE